MVSTTANENINIYVVTYNCNDMKLTGDEPSIENFVTRVIKNSEAESEYVPIYKPDGNTGDQTEVDINEKNIFIFGIQEAPKISNRLYPKMLNTITTNLNNNNNNNNNKYKSYYFDKTTISKTKLFIIYNVDKIDIVDEKFIDLSGRVINKFNKHALRVTIKHNNEKILTVITTHLRKGHLAPFFINDLKDVFKGNVYTDNIILFGDLNSRTLYKAIGSHGSFESYNDVNSSKITHIKDALESLKDIPLFQLSTNNPNFINTLKHKNYYQSDTNIRSIRFSNATNTLKNPTYRYNKETNIPTLNYRKTKKKVKVLGKVRSIFQRGKDKVKDEGEGKFKVPSYPDRVLYKSNTKLTLIKDSAHVLNYVGSDHLPVIVKFTYSVPATAAINSAAAEAPASATSASTALSKIYFMRHGHSCSNFVKDLQTQKQNTQLQSKSRPNNITYKNLQFIAKKFKKTHTLIKNPNLSYTGYLQTQKFIDLHTKINDSNSAHILFKLNNNNNNNNLIVFCSPLVRAMETAFFSYPKRIEGNNIDYRTFSYKYYNFDGKSVNITELNSNYIYVLPFIKEVGTTPDNAMPSIIDSKKKFLKFLDLININVNIKSLFTDIKATNLTFINKSTTNYQKLLKKFINKLPEGNDNNYVFVSHHKFIKKYLKNKDPITNTMILNSYSDIIYQPAHITNKNENKNKNICISGVNINSTPSYTPTKPVLLVKQQQAYYEKLASSDKFERKLLFNIL